MTGPCGPVLRREPLNYCQWHARTEVLAKLKLRRSNKCVQLADVPSRLRVVLLKGGNCDGGVNTTATEASERKVAAVDGGESPLILREARAISRCYRELIDEQASG